MDYKEFYKRELFPDIETPITDKLLKKNKWDKYVYIHAFTKEDSEYYYFDGDIGRIYAEKYDGKTSYKISIHSINEDKTIPIKNISDIKAVIYAYLCGRTGTKYGQSSDGGYCYLNLETDEENEKWRYDEYCKMTSQINII